MIKRALIITVLAVLAAGPVWADSSGLTSRIPVALNFIILAGAIACLAIAIRLFVLVKGGALAKGWQFLVISFATLAMGQIIVLAEKFNLFALSFDLATVFYAITIILWFVGLMQTRKVLG